ncbi:hypothetical protein LTR78_009372 [Recurvomyces mirabilis]|uniref:Uncharacterized protein n=1 Tax=Recurvomyces mirabilis TaxID=574656 RepID=A0AAE0TN82_9PEZI|nr:hypothetical protein LTR78_009372 [Recurvomyces mirabilis]KAK5154338.1 hypothetical protein LTS14_007023 [Recurvomyces mirabilis]
MKSAISFAALSSSLASAQYFGVTSARSGSAIQYLPMNAGNETIYLGGQALAYCPTNVGELGGCPENHGQTNFAVNSNASTLELGTAVPGGQQVYADPQTGALKYTIPHSAAMSEGAAVVGWSVEYGGTLGRLRFAFELLACQDGNIWPVYAVIPNATLPDGCLSFDALTVNQTEPAAWEFE